MNTKKHKSKNRAKLNPTPAQTQDNANEAREIENTNLVKKIEPDIKNEDNVQDINKINESLTVSKQEETVQKLDDNKETVADVSPVDLESPIKPKRNKGKKKKLTVREIDQNNKPEDNTKTVIIGNEKSISETNPIHTTIQDPCSVQPSIRKKKHKGKNPIGSTVEDVECAVELSLQEKSLNMENKEDELKHEFQIKNKKNKKKKRRHDSEKSENAEDKTSCTAAFDELITTRNNNVNLEYPIEDSTPIQEITKGIIDAFAENTEIKSTIEDFSEKMSDKEGEIDTHKKKKKEKKHPKSKNINKILIDIKNEDATSDVIQTNKEKSTTDSSLQSNILNEPKSKDKIVTSVQMKCIHNQNNIVTTESDPGIIDIENTLFEKNISEPTPSPTDRTKDSPFQLTESSQLSQNSEKNEYSVKNDGDIDVGNTRDVFKIEKCKETANFLDNIKQVSDKDEGSECKLKTEPEETNTMKFSEDNVGKELNYQSKEISNVKKDKKEDIMDENISETELIHESIINKQDISIHKDISHDKITISDEFYDNTPDFIHIPRSSSQQLLDDNNNNNMDIQEITSIDEIKLGIPVLTSNIIQGSGETPVSTPKIVDTGINITELESIPIKEEKTDLKSKMMEVNQDLEDLKMSLEKSLAELNAIEKDDQNSENKMKSYEVAEKKTDEINKPTSDIPVEGSNIFKPLADRLNEIENKFSHLEEKPVTSTLKNDLVAENSPEVATEHVTPPVCPSRRDRKGKVKTKKRGRREPEVSTATVTNQTANVATVTQSQETKNDNKSEEKPKSSDEKGKQTNSGENDSSIQSISSKLHFEPIENFEDALSTSVDDVDVNKKFEVIANELTNNPQGSQLQKESFFNNPEINITPPLEDAEKDAIHKNPVSQPKNLLGHPNISVSSSKTDYKKEKNKTPNSKQAKVKIKDDDVDIELDNISVKKSKQSQTDSKFKMSKDKNEMESFSYVTNEKEEYVYKYSFRKVFLASVCHVCRKDLKQLRLPCKFCNLIFYCSQKHKDEDWPRHQSLCFAVSTIVHLKDQKHVYTDAKNMSGQNYRLIRMQMILSCEKVLKRKLLPWEQEALLYPRICADIQCREWRQSKLMDCEGCGQVSYCIEHPEHLSPNHQHWCKSYALYQKLVLYQQSKGRLMPKLPGKVMMDDYVIPEKINEVLASMYDEKIDMSDIQYAALTQLATAPLTAAYCHQIYRQAVNYSNGVNKRSTFTIHAVGAELQFEADSLNKWEVFLLHLKPDVKDLRVALIGTELNPSNLPLDLLGKMKLCDHCSMSKRRVQFSFQDKSYREYWSSDDFTVPDIVCAFNPNIQRSSLYNETNWSSTINCIMKQKIPFLITSHTLEELKRDLEYIDDCTELNYKVISEARNNPFASMRPDRNFITDEETPLLFKNNCFVVLCGV